MNKGIDFHKHLLNTGEEEDTDLVSWMTVWEEMKSELKPERSQCGAMPENTLLYT